MALRDFMDLIRHDPRRSMVIRAVAGNPGAAMPDVETLWRKAVFSAQSGGLPLAGKFSLEDLIDTNKAIMLVDDGAGGQPVDVIFTSLVILTTETLPGGAGFVKFLQDRIMQRFGNVIPDGDTVNIRIGLTEAAEHPVTVYLGYGVHVPAADQIDQQGRIEIFAADGEAVGQPMISDGPAGLYAGQPVLAFSRSQSLTAAVHPDLPPGVIFCLGQPGGSGSTKGFVSALPPLTALPCSGDPDATSVEIHAVPLDTGSKADIRFDVTGVRAQRGRVRLCQIEVILDDRASRLHMRRPTGPLTLAVVGFAIPESFGGRRVARYWADRTIGGGLRTSAMLAECDSVVVQGREPRLYDRTDLRYLKRSAKEFSVERMSFGGDRRSLLLGAATGFGYLAPPRDMRSVVAGTGSGGANAFTVNWVGEAITLQFSSGETTRLSRLYGQAAFGMIGGMDGKLRTLSGPDIWDISSGKPIPAGDQDFGPGARIVIGPLVVDVMESR